MTVLIGLMGPAGAGKSSVATYLVEKYGATRYSFAGPLKEMVGRALEFSHAQCYGTQSEKEAPDERYGGKSARWFLQRIGTEGCRKTFGEDFWTRQLVGADGKIQREAPAIAVVEDARFINEAHAIRRFVTINATPGFPGGALETRQCGFVWRLETPDRETTADATHASEREWSEAPCDYIIQPTMRGLPQLFQLVDDACRHFKIFPKRRETAL